MLFKRAEWINVVGDKNVVLRGKSGDFVSSINKHTFEIKFKWYTTQTFPNLVINYILY